MWIDDDIIRRCAEKRVVSVWIPDAPVVVVGRGNDIEREVRSKESANAGVTVLRRYGGGGAVVLHSGCVVLSLGCWVAHFYQNKRYFEAINQAVIDALASVWPQLSELTQRGLSDIAWGDRKVAGTSLFRSRNYLLYQASILVQPEISLMDRFLAHPSREPDYRGGKAHGAFLSGLSDIADGVGVADVVGVLSRNFERCLDLSLEDQIDVQTDQTGNLYKRIGLESR